MCVEKKTTKLGKIGKVLMCKRVMKYQTSTFGEIPFYKISTFGGKADTFITNELFNTYRSKFSFPKKGDILISAAGTLGKTVIYDGEPAYFQDSNIVWIDNDETEITNKYLYYFYQTKPWITTNGSTINRIYNDNLKNIKITYPDIPSQNLINTVLSALDSKIELNNRINAELEAMAKTLYDYWFVQFDFPISEEQAIAMGKPELKGKPYKSSGGKMVYNKELKREIPDGWEVKPLAEIVSRIGTGLNPRDNFKLGNGSNYYITIKNIEYGKIIFDEKCDKIDDKTLEIINKRSDLKIGDILFTSIEPVGRTYLIQDLPRNWNINESVFTVRPNYELIDSEYLYMLLSSEYLRTFAKKVSTGSIHKGIRIGVLNSFLSPYKDYQLIKSFSEKINPILKRIYIVQQENQQLSSLRDWLLPMLMNGQVTVKDTNQESEDSPVSVEENIAS